ncbi:hypothetical protein GCM10010507_23110 [Streptomyces cinnamoneus]|uniref:Uncharacterized protein n=1 Tax=Streptomyces cinnamoneus TaxID=53446 RepID=A0A918TLA6_STRCJ|nr:hypothetical protein GCM10010507_23110 [Streptomyces cinnamoneus]
MIPHGFLSTVGKEVALLKCPLLIFREQSGVSEDAPQKHMIDRPLKRQRVRPFLRTEKRADELDTGAL